MLSEVGGGPQLRCWVRQRGALAAMLSKAEGGLSCDAE